VHKQLPLAFHSGLTPVLSADLFFYIKANNGYNDEAAKFVGTESDQM
jgi:hypothetical protein